MLKINKEKFKICIIFFAILFMDFFFIGHGFAAKTELSLDELKLTREEMTWLKSKESIRIGGPRAFPPFHYFDDQGRLKGISADYIFAIMNKLGVKLEVQKDLPWTEVLNKAKSGKIDLIPCAAKTIDREVYLNFSTPYLSFPLVILTSKDAPYIGGIEDLHGKKLAVIKKNAVSSWLKKDKIKFEPYYVESPLKKLETISFGRVDAGIENLAAASYIIQKYGLANVKIAAPTPYGNYNLHMAVRKDLPELLGVINKVIDSITPEQHIQIRSKWLSVRYEHGINKVYILKWILAISIFSMTIIVIVLFWNRRLKKAESALKESERKLSTLMDNLPGIAYQCLNDVNWTMLYISNGCYELTGYEPFELVKNQILSYGDLIVEDDRQYVEDEIQSAINGRRAFAIEYRIRDKNQNIKWLWEKGRGIFDKEKKLSSLEGFITDITERKQAEKKIKNHAANLKAIFDSTPNILVLVNDESRVEMINNRGAAFLGKKKEELYGLLGGEVFNCLNSFDGKGCGRNADCSLCPVRTQIMLTFQKGKPHTEEEGRMTFLLNEKEISMDLLISTALLNLDGANKVLLSLADITARKKAEAEKKKLESQLQQAQKMESIGTLAGGIAHDFNNILFPILGYAEMVLEDLPENSPFQDSLKGIFTSALRAKGLVKQILTFSRQDKNELKLMKMQPIIKEALKLIRSTIPTTIEIKQDINPDCGIIKADPTQIHQIVMNLATNAYHAMEDTGGELKVSLKQMEFKTLDLINPNMKPGVYACLIVADIGVGMDKNLTDKIFDPFFTTKAPGKGTGMGLSVIHGIVNSMNGVIQVYSEPEKGTQFHVYFPIEEDSFEKQATNLKAKIQSGIEQILLVDDEEAILTMEKRMLERLGYQVTSRTSSLEALEAFRANPDRFDLIITDMAMPNMPGDKLSVELTKIRPDIPVLLCTGFSEIMSEERAASLGIKGFLLKPIVMKDLAQKIRDVLDECKI